MKSAILRLSPVAVMLATALAVIPAYAAQAQVGSSSPSGSPCGRVEVGPVVKLAVGKATVLKLDTPVTRILLGNPENSQAARPSDKAPNATGSQAVGNQQNARRPGAADVDVVLLGPKEVYLLGKTVGSTNIALLDRAGQCTLLDVAVGMDTAAVTATLKELMPEERQIKVSSAADSLVLSGSVTDAAAADRAVDIAGAYVRTVSSGAAGGRAGTHDKIVNMLAVAAPQQVMLEVKVAEISRSLMDKLGATFSADRSSGSWFFGLLSSFGRADAAGLLSVIKAKTASLDIDAQRDNGLVKILAEPTVMAISGQEGSFLAGGKIFIPVAQSNNGAASTITLEEKEFGVSLKFTPTVLGDGRINLKVSPEVSELNAQGVGITVPGASGLAVLPSFTTRRAATTVQLFDGQSFAIGGLIKNNVTTNIKAFPLLGEIPILGTLFRSSDFQNDKSELVFVVTPRLVKPLSPDYPLPTDHYVAPNRAEFLLNGQMEGRQPEPKAPAAPAQLPAGGFEVK